MDMSQTMPTIEEQSKKIDRDLAFKDWIPTDPNVLYRLREGVERFFITDINNPAASAKAQSNICVMLDELSIDVTEFNHIPGGGNVLYMDGHVAWVRYPGEWPITTIMAWITGQ
jgi:prepilin-type processing-associated H-X9-DG protein